MADVSEDPVAPIVENVVENITAATNGTGKPPSTPEGMALAYGSLVVMALIPIFFGSFRSVKHQQQQKVRETAVRRSARALGSGATADCTFSLRSEHWGLGFMGDDWGICVSSFVLYYMVLS